MAVKSFGDWWDRVGRWQKAGREALERKVRPRSLHPVMEALRRETDEQHAAIMAMMAACPDYDGDLSEFGEEPLQRYVRMGLVPPPPYGPLGGGSEEEDR
ncbi:MAG TPA: hypothetical protein VF582_08555 [Allosphingosinicella sp.]|jgi:hypothetical protein